MTDKTATERLRELLDERGVEYERGGNSALCRTSWLANGVQWNFRESGDGYTVLTMSHGWKGITPEQAIVATLGEADEGCCLMYDGKKYPVELDFGFLGLMPITITVGGFRYLVEVPDGE